MWFDDKEKDELAEAALDVYNSYDTTGCDGCGVVDQEAMNKLEKLLRDLGVLVS
jgi:hypothetical protein